MTSALRVLTAETFRALLTRKASAVLLVFLFGLLTAVSCSLQVGGESVVNGQVIPIDDETRAGLAVGIAFAGIHSLGLLLVLFVLVPSLVGELDGGLATWILVRPVGRGTYLCARLLGAFLFLLAFSAFVVGGLEVLLARYAGHAEPRALLGGSVLVVLLGEYLLLGVAAAFLLGPGFGGLLVLVLAAAGAVVDIDAITRTLLIGSRGGAPAGLLDAFLAPIFGEAGPPMILRILYGIVYVLIPGSGNIHDAAVAATFGRGLGIREDLVSPVMMVIVIPLALAYSLRRLRKRDF